MRAMVVYGAARALGAMLRLPRPLQRVLGGRSITVDDQRLDPGTQLVLRLSWLSPLREPHESPDLAVLRRETDLASRALSAGVARAVRARDLCVPGGDGLLRARAYDPPDAEDGGPLLVFFHGGGFVLGSVDSHDGVCRFLAEHSGVRIVSVEYRLAPEHPFPAAVDDAISSFKHIRKHAADFGADPAAVAVGGDSAGGNLAAAVAHELSGRDGPVFTLLLYPTTELASAQRSHLLFGNGFLLDNELLLWCRDQYVPDPEHHADPRVSVLRDERISELPLTCVFTAGFNPLRDEGEAYAARLADRGVPVVRKRFSALRHGFALLVGVDQHATAAMHHVASALRCGVSLARHAA